ncbi:alpha/beta fold hydrolase [Nocardia sp. NPDC050175]|uniref:alpha/beta fold hydrolase n=1 Tax=Nocardia sp. NPDC050175 TaxID=3364317 RepID=UPI00378FC651
MFRTRRFALVGALVLLCGACATELKHGADTTAPGQGERGTVVSTTPVAQLSTEETAAYLAKGNFDTPVHNGVDAYRVDYRTITAAGEPTTASGLVVLPRTDSPRLRTVSFEHGTLVLKSDAPSVNNQSRPDQARTIMFAAAGYAAIAPDYLGLGDGTGNHPYTHAPTEVSASADLLFAAKNVAAQQHRELERDILVSGFSQGGHAAMAFGKALQADEVPGFGLAALAPVSGPYALRDVETPAGLDGRVAPGPAVFYFAYWLTAMNQIYHLYDSPAEAFQEPYAGKIEGLFDGTRNELTIATMLPITPDLLLTPKFVELAKNPTGAVLKAITDSDGTCDWTPRVPVRLYGATADRNVPYANAEHCLQALHSENATLQNLGGLDHTNSARAAMPQILTWFQQQSPPS